MPDGEMVSHTDSELESEEMWNDKEFIKVVSFCTYLQIHLWTDTVAAFLTY